MYPFHEEKVKYDDYGEIIRWTKILRCDGSLAAHQAAEDARYVVRIGHNYGVAGSQCKGTH